MREIENVCKIRKKLVAENYTTVKSEEDTLHGWQNVEISDSQFFFRHDCMKISIKKSHSNRVNEISEAMKLRQKREFSHISTHENFTQHSIYNLDNNVLILCVIRQQLKID